MPERDPWAPILPGEAAADDPWAPILPGQDAATETVSPEEFRRTGGAPKAAVPEEPAQRPQYFDLSKLPSSDELRRNDAWQRRRDSMRERLRQKFKAEWDDMDSKGLIEPWMKPDPEPKEEEIDRAIAGEDASMTAGPGLTIGEQAQNTLYKGKVFLQNFFAQGLDTVASPVAQLWSEVNAGARGAGRVPRGTVEANKTRVTEFYDPGFYERSAAEEPGAAAGGRMGGAQAGALSLMALPGAVGFGGMAGFAAGAGVAAIGEHEDPVAHAAGGALQYVGLQAGSSLYPAAEAILSRAFGRMGPALAEKAAGAMGGLGMAVMPSVGPDGLHSSLLEALKGSDGDKVGVATLVILTAMLHSDPRAAGIPENVKAAFLEGRGVPKEDAQVLMSIADPVTKAAREVAADPVAQAEIAAVRPAEAPVVEDPAISASRPRAGDPGYVGPERRKIDWGEPLPDTGPPTPLDLFLGRRSTDAPPPEVPTLESLGISPNLSPKLWRNFQERLALGEHPQTAAIEAAKETFAGTVGMHQDAARDLIETYNDPMTPKGLPPEPSAPLAEAPKEGVGPSFGEVVDRTFDRGGRTDLSGMTSLTGERVRDLFGMEPSEALAKGLVVEDAAGSAEFGSRLYTAADGVRALTKAASLEAPPAPRAEAPGEPSGQQDIPARDFLDLPEKEREKFADESSAWAEANNRKGHAYRGMSKAEFDDTVAKGRGVISKGAGSQEEGTHYGRQIIDGVDYAIGNESPLGGNMRNSDSYVVEVKRGPRHMKGEMEDLYVGGSEPLPMSDVTRIWRLKSDEYGRFEPSEVPVPTTAAEPRPLTGLRKPRKIQETKTGLAEFVRSEGGINYKTEKESGGWTGELDRLRKKGSGTTGLVSMSGGGMKIDALHRAAIHEGLMGPESTLSEFVEALTQEASPLARKNSKAEQRADALGYSNAEAEMRRDNPAAVKAYEKEQQKIRDEAAAEEAAERKATQEVEAGAEVDTSFDVGPGADVVVTKPDGSEVRGTFERETDRRIVLSTEEGKVTIPKEGAKVVEEPPVSPEDIQGGIDILRGETPTKGEEFHDVTSEVAKAALSAKRVVDTALDVANRALDLSDSGSVARRVLSLVNRASNAIPGVPRGKAAIKIARDLVRQKMAPHLMPREYLSAVAEQEGRGARSRHDAKDVARDLAVLHDGTPITEAQQEAATRFLTGEAEAADVIDAAGPEYLVKLKREKDGIVKRQRILRDLGVLSEETLKKWEGEYLTRLFKGIEEAKAKGELPGRAVQGERIPRVYQRKDLTFDAKQALGEYRDPALLVAQTRMRQEGMIEAAKLLKKISERDTLALPKDHKGPTPEGWKEVPNEHSRYGALAGAKVHPKIHAEIVATFADKGGLSESIARFSDTLLQEWKLGKTVLNPGTHGRNIIGNSFFAELSGESWLDPLNAPNFVKALQIAWAKPGSKLYQLKRALIEERIAGGDFLSTNVLETAAEIQAMRGTTWREKADAYAKEKWGSLKRWRVLEAIPGVDSLAALYQLEDVIPKIAAYVGKVRGKKLFGMESRAPMDHAAAAEQVRMDFPTFDALAPLRWLRSPGGLNAVGRQAAPPFLSFTANAAKVLARQAIRKPVTFAALAAALKAAQYGFTDLVSDKEKGQIDAASPNYRRPAFGTSFLPWRDSKGDLQLLDLRYAVPLGDEAQSVMDWFRKEKEVQDPGTRTMNPGGPFIGLLAQLWLNRNQMTGQDIDSSKTRGIGPNVSDAQGDRDTWKFIGQSLLPQIFPGGYSWNKIAEAIQQTPVDKRGNVTRDPVITFLDTIAGIKIRPVNVQRDVDSRMLEIDDILGGKLQRMKALAQAKNIPENDKRREHDEIQTDVLRLYNLSLRIRGLPQYAPQDVLTPTEMSGMKVRVAAQAEIARMRLKAAPKAAPVEEDPWTPILPGSPEGK